MGPAVPLVCLFCVFVRVGALLVNMFLLFSMSACLSVSCFCEMCFPVSLMNCHLGLYAGREMKKSQNKQTNKINKNTSCLRFIA